MANSRGLVSLVRYVGSRETTLTAGGRPLAELGLVRGKSGESTVEYLLLPGSLRVEANGVECGTVVGEWQDGVRLGVVEKGGGLRELTVHRLGEDEDPETAVALTLKGGLWLPVGYAPFRRGRTLVLPVERGSVYALGTASGAEVRTSNPVVPYRNGAVATGDDVLLEEGRPVELGERAVVTVIPYRTHG